MSPKKILISFLLCTPFLLLGKITKYNSQYGQDRYLNEHFFHDKEGGFFVDIGAHNGVTISDSLFYEKELGWKGICLESIGMSSKINRDKK